MMTRSLRIAVSGHRSQVTGLLGWFGMGLVTWDLRLEGAVR